MRVLFLDDDPYVLEAMSRLLRRDLEVEIASTFSQAWQRIATLSIDAVVSDQKLSDSATGLQFLELLAATHPEIIRVLMSGFEVRGWEKYAKALLKKPFTRDHLLAALGLRRKTDSITIGTTSK